MAVSARLPKNGMEFSKEWRRNCKTSESKYQYLLHVGADNLGRIFKAEVGFGLLGEFICCLNEQFQQEETVNVLSILIELSKTNRFDLNLQFLSSKEQDACSALIEKIVANSPSDCESDENRHQNVDDVKRRYRVGKA